VLQRALAKDPAATAAATIRKIAFRISVLFYDD
jgi:hypothetical protein